MAIQIERRVTGSGSWDILTSDAENPYIDNTAIGGVEYDYRAKIIEGELESPYSDIKSVITMEAETVPDTPTGLIAEAVSYNQINLSWQPTNGATSYKVEKLIDSEWETIGIVNDPFFTDNDVLPETLYSYRVTGINLAGEGTPSDVASETTPSSPELSNLIKINFGGTFAGTFPTPPLDGIDSSWMTIWHNVATEGNASFVLKDINGIDTPYILYAEDAGGYKWGIINGEAAGGNGAVTGDDSGIVPDNVSKFYWFTNEPTNLIGAKLRIAGFSQNDVWDIKIFSSRTGGNRKSRFQIGQEIKDIISSENTSTFLIFESISPDENGEINIILTGAETPNGYLNALILEKSEAEPQTPQVQNLDAVLQTNVILVSWDEYIPENEAEDGTTNLYRIERKVNEGDWELNREFEEEDWETGFFFWDNDVEEGNTYYYRIKAFTTNAKETAWSEVVFVTIEEDIEIPPVPTGLTANIISSNQINLSWNASAGADSYKIERRIGAGSWEILEAAHIGTSYNDTGLSAETEYSYRVSATNSAGTSSASGVATETTPPASSEVFNAPLLSAEIDISSQDGINRIWTPASENTVTADYYEFEKIEDDGSPTISGSYSGLGGTSKDTAVTEHKTYKYRCRGYHSVHGYTPWSDQVTINLIYLNREYDFTYPSPIQDVTLGAAFVYFPEAYRKNPTAEFPVIVYCHGQGERAGGTSPNFTKLANGAGFTKELRGKSNEIPVIAICPQVVGWGSFATTGMIDECVAAVISGLGLPLQHKFVLSGYSAGGNDTWPYVRNHDNTNVVGFIPFGCRLYIPSGNAQVQDYLDRELPTWIFHNINDTTQEPTNHIGFLNTVFTLDPDNDFIRGTIYDLSGHDPVTRTINTLGGDVVEGYYPYKNAGNELYDWISDVYFGNTPDPGPEPDPDPDPEEGLQREYDFTYTSEVQGVTGAAYVYIPQAYRDNPVSDFPVMVYCHGQGQRAGGTSPNFNALVSDDGYARWLRGTTNELPYIVISPQVVGWQSFALEGMIDEAFDKVRAELLPDLNPNKYVLSGWSAGGNDTWPFVRNTSTRVVGFVSFGCRLNIPTSNADVQAYINREIPTWVFHNNDDEIQDVSNHKAFLAAVNNIDPDIEYIRGTIYDAGGHPVVEKTISGIGDDVISGYYPYKNAGDELAEWISDVYHGIVIPSRFINIGFTTEFKENDVVEGWNTFALFGPSDPAVGLDDSEGLATGYTMEITAPFTSDSNSNISTGDNSGPVPDAIMSAFWYRSNGTATIEFVLDKAKKYKFTFYGGRDGSADDKSADFTIGSETVSLNGLHNLYNTVSIGNVIPDENNKVIVLVSNTDGYDYAILNAIMIEEF